MTPDVCPTCGEAVPPRARACPNCGADETNGWSEEAKYQSADIPEDPADFNYDDFAKREFGKPETKPRGVKWLWWVVAVGLLILLGWGFLMMGHR